MSNKVWLVVLQERYTMYKRGDIDITRIWSFILNRIKEQNIKEKHLERFVEVSFNYLYRKITIGQADESLSGL